MKGGCHCGAIRFEAQDNPEWVGACYCIDCRKISGAPYTVFADFKQENVRLFQGEAKEYFSSENVTRTFCAMCSSPLSFVYKNKPEHVFIPIGVFDDASSFAPKKHIWVSQKLPWVVVDTDAPQEH